jgi:hypothetical protein
MVKIDRSKVARFFESLEKHQKGDAPEWTRKGVPSSLKAMVGAGIVYWISGSILPMIQAELRELMDVVKILQIVSVVVGLGGVFLIGLATVQAVVKRIGAKRHNVRAKERNKIYFDEFRLAKLHDLIQARLRAFDLTRIALTDLKEFDAPDLYEEDKTKDQLDTSVLAQLADVGRRSVFFFGPAPWGKIVDVVRVETSSEIAFETNPIVTSTLFLSNDQIVIVQATLDLKRGIALEECVTRLFLSDLVRIQFRENRVPVELMLGTEAVSARERQSLDSLKKQINELGGGFYRKIREIVMTHTDQGSTVLPIGGRVILEKEASLGGIVGAVATREDAVVRAVDERLMAAKRSMLRRA